MFTPPLEHALRAGLTKKHLLPASGGVKSAHIPPSAPCHILSRATPTHLHLQDSSRFFSSQPFSSCFYIVSTRNSQNTIFSQTGTCSYTRRSGYPKRNAIYRKGSQGSKIHTLHPHPKSYNIAQSVRDAENNSNGGRKL